MARKRKTIVPSPPADPSDDGAASPYAIPSMEEVLERTRETLDAGEDRPKKRKKQGEAA